MLFNLPRQRQFLISNVGSAILGHRSFGPYFGNMISPALTAAFEPFNGNGKCLSWANEFGYKIPKEGGINMLTN